MRSPLALVWVVVGALVAGVALSFGQTTAPDGIAPLVNSALPVVTLAALAALAGRQLWACVALAAAAGPLAMVGYYGTSVLRGFGASSSSLLLWVGAGLVAGSVMGAAVWAMRQPREAAPAMAVRGAAVGFWPGIALGEAAHGLTRIADTTPTAYWWAQAAVGLVVLAALAATALDGVRAWVVAVTSTIVVAGGLYVAYGVL